MIYYMLIEIWERKKLKPLELFDKFDVTSSFKLNSKSGNNNETKNESQLFHCYGSGF